MDQSQCIFCRISAREVAADAIVRESDNVTVFYDHQPKAKVHLLGIPKQHWESLDDVPAEAGNVLGELLLELQAAAREVGIAGTGYRVITNCGGHAGQEVSHLHFHVLGGEPLGRMVCLPNA